VKLMTDFSWFIVMVMMWFSGYCWAYGKYTKLHILEIRDIKMDYEGLIQCNEQKTKLLEELVNIQLRKNDD
jgi:hypothetical protein